MKKQGKDVFPKTGPNRFDMDKRFVVKVVNPDIMNANATEKSGVREAHFNGMMGAGTQIFSQLISIPLLDIVASAQNAYPGQQPNDDQKKCQ